MRANEAHGVSTRGAVAQRHGQQHTQWWWWCNSVEEAKWKNGSGRAKEDERRNEVRMKEEERKREQKGKGKGKQEWKWEVGAEARLSGVRSMPHLAARRCVCCERGR